MTNKEKRQQLLSNELTIFEVEGLADYYFLLHTLPYGNENEYTIKSVERVEKEKGRIFGRDNKTMVIDKITPTTMKMFTFSLLDEYIKASIKLSNITIKDTQHEN